jgi:hypothetical protein
MDGGRARGRGKKGEGLARWVADKRKYSTEKHVGREK